MPRNQDENYCRKNGEANRKRKQAKRKALRAASSVCGTALGTSPRTRLCPRASGVTRGHGKVFGCPIAAVGPVHMAHAEGRSTRLLRTTGDRRWLHLVRCPGEVVWRNIVLKWGMILLLNETCGRLRWNVRQDAPPWGEDCCLKQFCCSAAAQPGCPVAQPQRSGKTSQLFLTRSYPREKWCDGALC